MTLLPALTPFDPDRLDDLHRAVLGWYAENARDLPWRRPDATAWGVLVSEVMLQQTPVARVLPVWSQWLTRWPTPADLAAEPPGEAVRAWGRLGYPRRALRLHGAATAIVERHGGAVPADLLELRALPGVGAYTAAAVAAFAFDRRHAVVDTNIRRVLARVVDGRALPAASLTAAETRLAERLLPADESSTDEPPLSPTWNVAVMELGALVCTARSPRCEACPVRDHCRWHGLGRPAHDGPPRRGQAWSGTDRQVRGRIMAIVRAAHGPVTLGQLSDAWEDEEQGMRCLESLLADGLLEALDDQREKLALPGMHR
ncbi:MAG TPA: A/G-specific adenine glycosylase [Actinomycetales bacterium]|nr:A/G-specific adenine glycosylase [Actinomycetales bacterium]